MTDRTPRQVQREALLEAYAATEALAESLLRLLAADDKPASIYLPREQHMESCARTHTYALDRLFKLIRFQPTTDVAKPLR